MKNNLIRLLLVVSLLLPLVAIAPQLSPSGIPPTLAPPVQIPIVSSSPLPKNYVASLVRPPAFTSIKIRAPERGSIWSTVKLNGVSEIPVWVGSPIMDDLYGNGNLRHRTDYRMVIFRPLPPQIDCCSVVDPAATQCCGITDYLPDNPTILYGWDWVFERWVLPNEIAEFPIVLPPANGVWNLAQKHDWQEMRFFQFIPETKYCCGP